MDLEKGLVSRGQWGNIQAVMDRAAEGEPIKVAFLGGSITQGSLSSTPETCYAYLVYRWWTEKFPKANIAYINAGIGGTTSQFGVARVGEDVLRHQPDFVLMEFSVNDDDTPHFQETYEGLVRGILKDCPALLLMNNVCYDTGSNAEDMHLPIACHYGLPSVSMKSTIYDALRNGEMQNRDITPDDLHPNDTGHALVAKVVCHYLEKIWAAPREPISREIPAPLTKNRYENSKRMQNHNSQPVISGFDADFSDPGHITKCFRRGWTAWKTGASIEFSVHGCCIGVQYRKSVKQPAPIAKITVDGAHEMLLDANFRETWGDCLYLDTVCEGIEYGNHTVRVEIVEANDPVVPFYLVSIIGS